ncbi:MAG: hypothetical protein ACREIA_17330 [Opitutaceae bacterium]
MKAVRNALVLLALAAGLNGFAAPVVVTNSGIESEGLNSSTIKAVFKGKKVSWKNNTPVVLAVLKEGPVHEEFLKTAFDISPSAFSNHWRLTAMSGGGIAPKTFASEAELLQFVSSTPGAIGYVDEASANDSVKKVALE